MEYWRVETAMMGSSSGYEPVLYCSLLSGSCPGCRLKPRGGFHPLIIGALTDDLAVLHEVDDIAIFHGSQAVSNYHDGLFPGQRPKSHFRTPGVILKSTGFLYM